MVRLLQGVNVINHDWRMVLHKRWTVLMHSRQLQK